MLSKTLFAGLVLALTFAALTIAGCNEGNAKPAATGFTFPASCIAEEIPSSDKDIKKIARITDTLGNVIGYKLEMISTSRSGPFDILVALKPDGCVLYAEVVKYRATHGRKVRSKSFTAQFKGKCPGDAVEIGNDIDAITSATLSSKAMTKSVKKAITLVTTISQ